MSAFQRLDLLQRVGPPPLQTRAGVLERPFDQGQVRKEQVRADLGELGGGVRVGTERSKHQAQRVRLPQRGQRLRARAARRVDEPHLRGDDARGSLEPGQNAQARIGNGNDGLVRPASHRAGPSERGE